MTKFLILSHDLYINYQILSVIFIHTTGCHNSNNQRLALYQTEENKVGTYMPPVLRLSPGDTIKLKLNNNLTGQWTESAPQDTNFPYHERSRMLF